MLNAVQSLDGGILLWIQEHLRVGWLNDFFAHYTNLGEAGILWIVIALIFCAIPRTRKAGVLGLAAMGLCYVGNDLILKQLVARPRPFLSVEGLTTLISRPDSYSFPSGHSCSSLAAASVWLRTLPIRWLRYVLLGLALLMAFSRLFVGVHYPTDVLTGCLLGMTGGWLVCRWLGPLYDRRLGRAHP